MKFVHAIKFFMDGVFTHFPNLENKGDVFAADVESHKDCIKNYLIK